MNRDLRLLPPSALLQTSRVDHADWNFKPVLGWIQRLRYKLVISLLAERRFPRLLEIGYGSGVFMPELARHCYELYGIDVHKNQVAVARSLSMFKVDATLSSGSAETMPFGQDYFDCIVAVSTLEFIPDLNAACAEIRRILKPDGTFVVITPGHSPIVDLGLKVLTRQSASKDYDNRRQAVIPTLLKYFEIKNRRDVFPIGVRLYTALELYI